MGGLLVKSTLLIAMTHGIRVLGRFAGPRRGALVLGMPCTTAVVLIDCGHQRGVDCASTMAEASLLGLIAAVVLPLVYARMLVLGWRLPWVPMIAVAGYIAVAWGFSLVPGLGALSCLTLAAMGLLAACRWAERIPLADGDRGMIGPSRMRCLILRTAVPVVCLAVVTILREAAGAHWAGLLSTFPAMTLTVLVVSHLEAGAAEAGRIAKGLPRGNLAMIAFLGAFRFGCPALGLTLGAVCGYALAAAALLFLEGVTRWQRPDPLEPSPLAWPAGPSWHWPVPPRPAGPLVVRIRQRASKPVRRTGSRRRLATLLVEPIGL